MAQRTQHLGRHGAGSGVTRRCPDNNFYDRFELDMNSHLDLAAAVAALPSPRTPPEAESARSAAAGAAKSAP
ncbi:hypothetical protein ACFRQM_48220 [Streptomyces sp. NPDC056831]|uniref:hypothetical protein n=1 Tax=Streptomyces sp. NPDC056831 TaxID=3345954 RepID=UPI0036C38599